MAQTKKGCMITKDGQFRIPNPKDSNPKCHFKPNNRIRFISCLQPFSGRVQFEEKPIEGRVNVREKQS